MANRADKYQEIKDGIDLRDVMPEGERIRRNGECIQMLCPFHTETTPSMSVYASHYHCYGCGAHGDIFDWLQKSRHLNESDAYLEAAKLAHITVADQGVTGPSRRNDSRRNRTGSYSVSLRDYAQYKNLPMALLQEVGVSEQSGRAGTRLRMSYRDDQGNEVAARFRHSLDGDVDGRPKFSWGTGASVMLYGLDRLQRYTGEDIVLVEGESDCHTAWNYHIPALGLPGASTWNDGRDAQYLSKFKRVLVVHEPDSGGEALLKSLNESSIRDKIWVVRLPSKDLSSVHLQDAKNFLEIWERACAKAVPLSEAESSLRAAQMEEAFAQAQDLLSDPDFLVRIDEAIKAQGYAGDTTAPKLCYVALTSRLLERPMNLALVAPSASGKNRAVDVAVALVPEEACHKFSAHSEHALIYSDASFKHRMIVIAEADSIPNEGPAASAVRALAADNRMVYETVEQVNGQFRSRKIEKEGPTGIITTSTERLPHQLNTRVLEVLLLDDPERVHQVLMAQAAQAAGVFPEPEVSFASFHAVQRYLETSPIRTVKVPYAPALVPFLATNQVRMQRDFPQILACIKAIALLHQYQREKVSETAIVASLDDYAAARRLILPSLQTIANAYVTPGVRATVEAVRMGEEISQAELARRLKVPETTLAYRVKRACDKKWLENRAGPNEQKRLARREPLPDDTDVLPTVEELKRAWKADPDSSESTQSGQIYESTNEMRAGAHMRTDVNLVLPTQDGKPAYVKPAYYEAGL